MVLVQKDIKKIYLYVNEVISVTGVSLDKSFINLTTVGQTEQLTATITPSNADDQTVTWTSSDTTIATVSSTGLVTCVTPGTATITVTTHDGGFTDSCNVYDSAYTLEVYTFSNGSPVQSGWTITQGSFKPGSLGTNWITAGAGSQKCEMSRDMSQWGIYKVQWKCYIKYATRGGNCYVGGYTSGYASQWALFWDTATVGGRWSGFKPFVGSTGQNLYQSSTNGYYICEMIFDGTDYTANLYTVGQNDEPGTLLATDTWQDSTTYPYFDLVHEHADDGFSETEWIKVWHL